MDSWQTAVVRLLAAYYAVGGFTCVAGAVYAILAVQAYISGPVLIALGVFMLALARGLWVWKRWAYYAAVALTALPLPALLVLLVAMPSRIGVGNVVGAGFASLACWCLTRPATRSRFL